MIIQLPGFVWLDAVAVAAVSSEGLLESQAFVVASYESVVDVVGQRAG